jgi:hypothetical protein
MKSTALIDLDSLLGPVDTGPPQKWIHITAHRTAGPTTAFCGAIVRNASSPYGTLPGRRCPDCERIRKARLG